MRGRRGRAWPSVASKKGRTTVTLCGHPLLQARHPSQLRLFNAPIYVRDSRHVSLPQKVSSCPTLQRSFHLWQPPTLEFPLYSLQSRLYYTLLHFYIVLDFPRLGIRCLHHKVGKLRFREVVSRKPMFTMRKRGSPWENLGRFIAHGNLISSMSKWENACLDGLFLAVFGGWKKKECLTPHLECSLSSSFWVALTSMSTIYILLAKHCFYSFQLRCRIHSHMGQTSSHCKLTIGMGG